MRFLKLNYCIHMNTEEFEKAKDITIIDYGVDNFYYYKNVLNLVNGIYLNLIKRDINSELLKQIENIIEKLNNLEHFEIHLPKISNEKLFVENYIKLFDTFKYKKLSEFNITTNIKIFNPKYITQEEISLIEDNTKISEEIKNKYLDYYIGDLEEEHYPIISCQEGMQIVSLINNNTKTIIEEMIEMFKDIEYINIESFILNNYFYFEITKKGLHKEIIYIINRLLSALYYLFNTTSFKQNEYYLFDKIEIENNINFDLEEEIEYAKKVVNQQINLTLSI